MAASRADQHDQDKLARWHQDLAGGVSGAFPLYALFLVSEDDRAAHDVFRAFRSRFEELGAGFQHLVIFGQHGVSQAEQTLLTRLGMAADAIPSLVLLTVSDPPLVYSLPAHIWGADSCSRRVFSSGAPSSTPALATAEPPWASS